MSVLDRMKLNGRVALVTGGAGGMGRAIATQLRDLGARVVLADMKDSVSTAAADLSTADNPLDWVTMDVTSSASVDASVTEVVKRHGKLDILVANAGISYEQGSFEHSDENWRWVMAVNLDGAFYCIRAAGRHMAAAGGGAIVAISSIAGVTAVRPEVHIGYDVSKAGIAHMCRNLAVEWAAKNIRINAVGPAYTDTEMLQTVGRTRPEVMRQWLDDMPIRRLMAPREVADAVAFLASDAASGITGHELMVDGGYSVS